MPKPVSLHRCTQIQCIIHGPNFISGTNAEEVTQAVLRRRSGICGVLHVIRPSHGHSEKDGAENNNNLPNILRLV